MDNFQVKQRIHDYIDQADDRFLTLINGMVEAEMKARADESMEDIANDNVMSVNGFRKENKEWGKQYTK